MGDRHSLKLGYTVDKTTNIGSLEHTGVPVVTYPSPTPEYYQGLLISHDNYLHSFFFDDDEEVMVHRHCDGTIKLSLYLEMLKIRNQVPVLSFAIKNMEGVIVDQRKYVNPRYRLVLKCMTRFISDQHVKGLALTPFEIDDLICIGDDVKYEEQIKFVRIGLIGVKAEEDGTAEEKNGTAAEDMKKGTATAEDMKANFLNLHKIVTDMFEGFSIPMELENWLELIKSLKYERADDGRLLLHHIVLMSPKESVLFFQSCHETIHNLSQADLTKHWRAINSMHHTLDKEAGTWGQLYNWYNRFSAGVMDGAKVFPTDACFVFENKHLRYRYQPNPRDNIYAYEVTVSMLLCCRDVTVHIQRHSSDKLTYTCVERMIMKVFGKDLIALQKHLHEADCLLPFVINH